MNLQSIPNLKTRSLLLLFLLGLLFSCDIKKSDIEPSDEFSKIFDHPDMNLAFYPVDFEQTPDGGFLVLSVYTDTTLSTFPLIHLMKTDKAGKKVWDSWVDKEYTSAVPSLLPNGNNYRFICMDAVNQEIRIMTVDSGTGETSEFTAFSSQYPLYSIMDSNGDILILSFDRQQRTSILTKYTEEFSEIWSHEFAIIDDVKHLIETHLSRTGIQFPFFIGQLGTGAISNYYVNCFYNYTMTMLFTDAAAGTHTGTLYTFQDDAAVSSAVSVEDNRFALSRYYSGDNFVNPSVTLNPAEMQSVTDFTDFSIPELAPNAVVKCLHETINGKNLVVFASQTRTNQLVLFFYDAVGGELQSVKFLNEKYPVSLAALDYTQEEGLALLVQTYVIGRFPRINLIKLSPEDLK